ncbi:hypothetical protein P872_24770 [Rhodonellum psychrophilum GCM71 = DSM 17998]|uniref:Uncharacterized protein n=1 Tax=Rhodonellum psychrophilum GCM71 = DSM 17998 TaxID=1123057 RepID=U5C3J6_9BACT|nr:hypothetical protein P872_24770 [Rhodonellum psychrophilum GCM71 = DSM 17998]
MIVKFKVLTCIKIKGIYENSLDLIEQVGEIQWINIPDFV